MNIDDSSLCNIRKQSGTTQLLRSVKLIIWDKTSMAKLEAIEILDRTLKDIIYSWLLFHGKVIVFGGKKNVQDVATLL